MSFLDKLPWNKKEEDPFANGSLDDAPNFSQNRSSQDFSQGFDNTQFDSSFGNNQPQRNPSQFDGFSDSPNKPAFSEFSDPMGAPMDTSRRDSDHGYEEMRSRDVELILAKLDALKAELDSVHQRVRKIEQSTESPQTKKYNW